MIINNFCIVLKRRYTLIQQHGLAHLFSLASSFVNKYFRNIIKRVPCAVASKALMLGILRTQKAIQSGVGRGRTGEICTKRIFHRPPTSEMSENTEQPYQSDCRYLSMNESLN